MRYYLPCYRYWNEVAPLGHLKPEERNFSAERKKYTCLPELPYEICPACKLGNWTDGTTDLLYSEEKDELE